MGQQSSHESRVGNLLISFLSDLSFFAKKLAHERFTNIRVICSFALLWWVTWVNRSQSLFSHEWPERFAHGRSFVMSDLNNSLTVAHVSWAIWAKRSQSLIKMSNFEWMRDEPIGAQLFWLIGPPKLVQLWVLLTRETSFSPKIRTYWCRILILQQANGEWANSQPCMKDDL